MRVAVGSRNPVKVEAVEACFNAFFDEVVIEAVEVEGIPQPIGFEEALRGAVERAVEAIDKSGADLGVGLEAGLIENKYAITGYMNQHVCAIVDGWSRVTFGLSAAFEFPFEVVEGVLSGKAGEAEEVMEDISGIRGIGSGVGAVGYLTGEKLTRKDLCVQAVLTALIPRINPQLYPGKWPTTDEVLPQQCGCLKKASRAPPSLGREKLKKGDRQK
ncbi:MAG: inosine/xanthosine triphosphatase [Nitrososphaerota archaeon]|nr:inosine/xanthosine triphosphatase [Nitrososphaerota archaeon]